MIIKFDYNSFLIMDGEKLLSISHHFFTVFTCKNRIMLSVKDKPIISRRILFRVRHRRRHALRLLLCAVGRPEHVAPRPDDGLCAFLLPIYVLCSLAVNHRPSPTSFSWTSSQRSRTRCSSSRWQSRSCRSSG